VCFVCVRARARACMTSDRFVCLNSGGGDGCFDLVKLTNHV